LEAVGRRRNALQAREWLTAHNVNRGFGYFANYSITQPHTRVDEIGIGLFERVANANDAALGYRYKSAWLKALAIELAALADFEREALIFRVFSACHTCRVHCGERNRLHPGTTGLLTTRIPLDSETFNSKRLR
jgi:hypothetical protein